MSSSCVRYFYMRIVCVCKAEDYKLLSTWISIPHHTLPMGTQHERHDCMRRERPTNRALALVLLRLSSLVQSASLPNSCHILAEGYQSEIGIRYDGTEPCRQLRATAPAMTQWSAQPQPIRIARSVGPLPVCSEQRGDVQGALSLFA